MSFIFYSGLFVNCALLVVLLANALSAMTAGILSHYPALLVATLLFIVAANICTSNAAPFIRWVSMVGTISTVLLLAVLVAAEVQALLRFESLLPDESKSDIPPYYIDVEVDDGEAVQYDAAWAEQAQQLIRRVLRSASGEFLFRNDRVYYTEFLACLKSLGIFG